MVKRMIINIPDSIKEYEPELRFFIDTMVQKLNINRHKGFCEQSTVGELVNLTRQELDEMNTAHVEESQFNFFLECVDVSNMAWLSGLKAMRMTRDEWEDR